MLNLAGPAYDLGDVLFAVLQECEHGRRAFAPDEAAERLRETARAKLDEIRESYEECGGTEPYWRVVEREVLETALPQYVPAAIEQTRLETGNYDLWRRGDPAARAAFGLLGLVIGGLIIAIPWIPIFEEAFAFILALAGFLYPEVKKTAFDYRHSRLLNRLIAQAEKYQRNEKIQYVSEAKMREELEAVERIAPKRRVVQEKTAEGSRGPQGKERA
ncbi:MAG TPA: hypothetical protein VHC97_24930 [Thermoanaerobaculia bacterium]|jgi:hypothetical protein|nr:hypothetical protein [Thermoanaerobaculia bacterium]